MTSTSRFRRALVWISHGDPAMIPGARLPASGIGGRASVAPEEAVFADATLSAPHPRLAPARRARPEPGPGGRDGGGPRPRAPAAPGRPAVGAAAAGAIRLA